MTGGRVNRRLVSNTVAGWLAGVSNVVGYYAQVGRPLPGVDPDTVPADPAAKDPATGDLRVRPYLVFYPGPGNDGPDPSIADCGGPIDMTFRITLAAGDVEDLLALVDRVTARLDRWTPTVSGHVVGRLRHPTGWVGGTVLVDRDVTPHRVYTLLEYVTTATTTGGPQ
jgi:hypothetical protein